MACDKLIVTFNDNSGTIARRRHSPSLQGPFTRNVNVQAYFRPFAPLQKARDLKQDRRRIMRRNLLVMTMAAAGLSIVVAGDAEARMGVGTQARANVHANAGINASHRMTTTRTFTARAQARGPELRPPGWSHGRKTGWNCRVGARGCIPPGLRSG